MDIKDIKAIIDLMKKNSVTEFELEKEEFKSSRCSVTGKFKKRVITYTATNGWKVSLSLA